MRLRTTSLALVAALLIAAPSAAPAGAAPGDDRPPRTQGATGDPRGDATGPAARRPQADVLRVRYSMPLAREQRRLGIAVDLDRVEAGAFPGEPGPKAPEQRVKTFVDGPGALDWVVSFSNRFRPPRVVRIDRSGQRREVRWDSAGVLVAGGRDGAMQLDISTEWLYGKRARFTARGVSGRAEDRTRTVGPLNTRSAGRDRGNPNLRAPGAPTCTTVAGGTRCEWTR